MKTEISTLFCNQEGAVEQCWPIGGLVEDDDPGPLQRRGAWEEAIDTCEELTPPAVDALNVCWYASKVDDLPAKPFYYGAQAIIQPDWICGDCREQGYVEYTFQHFIRMQTGTGYRLAGGNVIYDDKVGYLPEGCSNDLIENQADPDGYHLYCRAEVRFYFQGGDHEGNRPPIGYEPADDAIREGICKTKGYQYIEDECVVPPPPPCENYYVCEPEVL